MALSRRQTNYYQGITPQPIYSMFNPQVEASMSESLRNRQGRFDAAVAGSAAEIARIGDLETADKDELTNRLKAVEGGIKSIVNDKYNGDYSAAAPELTQLIAKERNDPFYSFNKDKVEAVKLEQKARMQLGANYLSAKSPSQVKYADWQRGATLDFQPVNRQDIVKQAAFAIQGYANQIVNDPVLRDTKDGRFVISKIQSGFKDKADVMNFLATNPELVNSIMSTPGLQGLNEGEVMNAIYEGAHAGIGKTNVNIMRNPSFSADGETTGSPIGLFRVGTRTQYASESKVVRQELQKAIEENPELQEAYQTQLNKALEDEGYSQEDWREYLKSPSVIVDNTVEATMDNTIPGIGAAKGLVKNINKRRRVFKDIEKEVYNYISEQAMTWMEVDDLNAAVSADSKLRTRRDDTKKSISNEINKMVLNNPEKLRGLTDKADKALENMGDIQVLGFGWDQFRDKLVISLSGEKDKDGERDTHLYDVSSSNDAMNFIQFFYRSDPVTAEQIFKFAELSQQE